MVEVKQFLKAAEDKMALSVEFLGDTLSRIRAGKANVHILDGVKVEYYGSVVPLSTVATVATPDAKTITVQPWEKSLMKEIEKAILNSDVGITPDNNGEIIRLGIPPLTEERRKELAKQAKQEAEGAKMGVRSARRDAIDGLKKAIKDGLSEDVEKDAENDVQKLHDKYIKKIDEVYAVKEREILTV